MSGVPGINLILFFDDSYTICARFVIKYKQDFLTGTGRVIFFHIAHRMPRFVLHKPNGCGKGVLND